MSTECGDQIVDCYFLCLTKEIVDQIWDHLDGVALQRFSQTTKQFNSWIKDLLTDDKYYDLTQHYLSELHPELESPFEIYVDLLDSTFEKTSEQIYQLVLTTFVIYQDIAPPFPEPIIRKKRCFNALDPAITAALPNDTVLVLDGQHNLSVQITKPLSFIGINESVSLTGLLSIKIDDPTAIIRLSFLDLGMLEETCFDCPYSVIEGCVLSCPELKSGSLVIRNSNFVSGGDLVELCLPMTGISFEGCNWEHLIGEEWRKRYLPLLKEKFRHSTDSRTQKHLINTFRWLQEGTGELEGINDEIFPLIWERFTKNPITSPEDVKPLCRFLLCPPHSINRFLEKYDIVKVLFKMIEEKPLSTDPEIMEIFFDLIENLITEIEENDYKKIIDFSLDQFKKWEAVPNVTAHIISNIWSFFYKNEKSKVYFLENYLEKVLEFFKVSKGEGLSKTCGVVWSLPRTTNKKKELWKEPLKVQIFKEILDAFKKTKEEPTPEPIIGCVERYLPDPLFKEMFLEADGFGLIVSVLQSCDTIETNDIQKIIINTLYQICQFEVNDKTLDFFTKVLDLMGHDLRFVCVMGIYVSRDPRLMDEFLKNLNDLLAYVTHKKLYSEPGHWKTIDFLGTLSTRPRNPIYRDIFAALVEWIDKSAVADKTNLMLWLKWAGASISGNREDQQQVSKSLIKDATRQIAFWQEKEKKGVRLRGKTQRGFGSVSFPYHFSSGKWYYEVTLCSSGVFQIGWMTKEWKFDGNNFRFSVPRGVGDLENSWGIDFSRMLIWDNGENRPYGGGEFEEWEVGSVVGCLIDCDKRKMRWSLNGKFGEEIEFGFEEDVYPALSVLKGEQCYVNFGLEPFVHEPELKDWSPVSASKSK